MAAAKIVFLILPKVHLLDLAGPDQVFHEACDYSKDIQVDYCSNESELESSSQLHIGKLKHFSDISFRPGDYLVIPGAEVDFLLSKRMASEKKLFQWVTDAHADGVNICSICTGAFFLAMTGLLDGIKCTTHWKRTAELQQKFPSIKLAENILFTEDNRIFTSAGVTAGIDMALHILAKLKGDNFSFTIARELVVYVRRQGSDAQQSVFMSYRNHIHAGIHKVQDFIQENSGKRIPFMQLCDVACMSTRNLTRVFKKETGISISEFVTLIRKERLRHLLKNPDITRKEMASQCGLKSERQVIRLIKSF